MSSEAPRVESPTGKRQRLTDLHENTFLESFHSRRGLPEGAWSRFGSQSVPGVRVRGSSVFVLAAIAAISIAPSIAVISPDAPVSGMRARGTRRHFVVSRCMPHVSRDTERGTSPWKK